MAKLGIIISEDKVFAGDLIYFNFKKSGFTPDEAAAVISHEFSIDNTNWINVTQKKDIAWMFSVTGNQTIYLKLTSTTGSETFQKTITVLEIAAQKLFSNDTNIAAFEPDIMKWLPPQWSSWNIIHLRAQDHILNILAEKRIVSQSGAAYTKDDISNRQEVRDWASTLALYYIFYSISNADNDVFKDKAKDYEELSQKHASTARLSLDYNKNAIADDEPTEDLRSIELVRA